MKKQTFQYPQFLWVDIENPSEEELKTLSEEYQIPHHALKDCLQSDHLPKYEEVQDIHFLILRLLDDQAPEAARSIQSLTRKIAIFQKKNFIITVHRSRMISWEKFQEKKVLQKSDITADGLVASMMKFVFRTFEHFLIQQEEQLTQVTSQAFSKEHRPIDLETFHLLIRKVSLMRRILRMQMDVVSDFDAFSGSAKTYLKDAHEEGDRIYFFADDLYDSLYMTLQTYFSQSSHRTNEIMRVMTLFSAFFLPITFIAGIYGMNFDHMPELRQPWGYYATLLAMVGVSLGIAVWAYKKGWFQRN